jgi:hypothetical protein
MGLDGRKLLGAVVPELREKAEVLDGMVERFGLKVKDEQAAEVEESMHGLWKMYMDRVA